MRRIVFTGSFLVLLVSAVLLALTMLARAEDAPLALAPEAEPPADRSIKVYDHRAEKVIEMALERYLEGVVPAEMPISYQPEALKAQAVAARTYAARKLEEFGGSGCKRHPEADICTDPNCCQAYASAESLAARWGDQAEANAEKIREVLSDTRGQMVLYRGELIEAMYHAASGGHTEDVEQVYAEKLPYLRGVVSKGEQFEPGYVTDQAFTREQLASRLGVSLDGKLKNRLKILETTESGRVTSIRAADKVFTGRAFRKALDLRSALFTMRFDKDSVTFTTTGYGHGVGMSQTGANAMAMRGADYIEILTWYYTGTEVKTVKD